MSLYNSIFGINRAAGTLLLALGIGPGAVPRFRDCYLAEDADEVVIYTRTGGGNRDHYDYDDADAEGPRNAHLRKLPGFLGDRDDDFDSTFAYFRYAIPATIRPIVEAIRASGGTGNPAKAWHKLLADMDADVDTPETRKAKEIGKVVVDNIMEDLKSGNPGPFIIRT